MSSNAKDTKSISSLLDRPHLEQSTTLPPSDPVIATRIRATLDEIVAFKDNPRHSRNPKFEEIKASIRNRGLDHAPNVTRKTPSDPYMIKDGGNTRLQILTELWRETGEERFYSLDLMFIPWRGELDILIGHAVENEMRGSMMFIERALHAKKIRDAIAATEGSALSINALSKRITQEGWSLDDSNLGQMLYAVETLFDVIPETLWGGIGRDTVKKIRKLLDASRNYWQAVSEPVEGSFDEVWIPVFRKLDGDGFDVEKAEYQLCGEMARRMDGPILSVTAQLQALLEGMKNLQFERPSRYQPNANIASAPSKKQAPNRMEKPTPPVTLVGSMEAEELEPGATKQVRQEQLLDRSDDQPYHSQQSSNCAGEQFYNRTNQLDAELGLRKYSLIEIPGGTPLLYGGYAVHTTEYLQIRARDTAIAYATRWGIAQNIHDTVGQPGKQIGFWVSPDGLELMNEAVRIHWAMLSIYSLIRFDDRSAMLLENMAKAFNGEIDTMQTVSMLMAVTHARTLVLGERARGENAFFNDVWEEIAELEAITSILVTRTFEESEKIDEIPDQSFFGIERETGDEHE